MTADADRNLEKRPNQPETVLKRRQNAPADFDATTRELWHATQAQMREAGQWDEDVDGAALERYCRAMMTGRRLHAQAAPLEGERRLKVLALAMQADRDAGQAARDLGITPALRQRHASASRAVGV